LYERERDAAIYRHNHSDFGAWRTRYRTGILCAGWLGIGEQGNMIADPLLFFVVNAIVVATAYLIVTNGDAND